MFVGPNSVPGPLELVPEVCTVNEGKTIVTPDAAEDATAPNADKETTNKPNNLKRFTINSYQ